MIQGKGSQNDSEGSLEIFAFIFSLQLNLAKSSLWMMITILFLFYFDDHQVGYITKLTPKKIANGN